MRIARQSLSLLALGRVLHGQSLPYNPARILLASNSTTAYIFQPSSKLSGRSTLATVDISNSLSASQLSSKTISETLPFENGELVPYTPTIESDGSLTVLAGKCADGASGAQIWRYAPKSDDESGDYTWWQSQTSDQGLGDKSSPTGSNYLAAGIVFSDYIDGGGNVTSAFVFGGMCPTSDSTASNWQSDAAYSNSMLNLSPHNTDFEISLVASRGPPISQAGISLTPLPPTYSTNSDGALLTQQQDFVLLGGHTQSAFVNTSQLALFSLPQQSWSFVPVQQPSNAKTDLAIRQSVQQVTPRSGHTAVLSENGNSIIVFGGWVGDVNTPAQPQLAVLKLGAGYGGSGDWSWHVPQQSGQGRLSGSGIYGHGATILPGEVMMIVGGYEISSSSSKRIKRNPMSSNSRAFFYNTTSNTWLQSYTLPASFDQQYGGTTGPLSSKSQKVGLGTGLGIGAALLTSVVAFYFWYSKRLKRAREERQRVLLTYSSDGSTVGQMEQPFLDNGGIDGRGGDEFALGRFWPTGGQAGNSCPKPPATQHATGAWVNVPSPTRGLRKGAVGKNYQYLAAPRYDDNRLSRGSGNIHPIAEHENEDEVEATSIHSDRDGLSDAEAKLREVERMLNSNDPFTDPEPDPLGSHPVSNTEGDTLRRVPTGASRISVPSRNIVAADSETANWKVERGPNEAYFEDDAGRNSPSKSDDRTSSTLSERSQRSTASTSSITRTMSTRTGAIMAAAAVAQHQVGSQGVSPSDERSNTMSTDTGSIAPSYFRTRARSSTNGSVTPGARNILSGDGDSIITTTSNFAQLQSEGEALLGGRPAIDRDDPYQRALAAHTATVTNKRSPSGNKDQHPVIQPRQRAGLMGSLRRALNAVSITDRTLSLTSSLGQYKDEIRSASSSPTKDRPGKIGSGPRRAVSDGGALLRQKRGQSDWDEKHWPPYRDDPHADDWGEPKTSNDKREAEEDWDVEGAASNRDFQVMFTVPKSRLRVVNDDMDRASLRSASDGAVSRNGSVKNLRREDSFKALRARSDGDQPRLASTEEEQDESAKEKEKEA